MLKKDWKKIISDGLYEKKKTIGNVSQTELGEMVGLSRGTIVNIFSESGVAGLESLGKMAAYLGVSIMEVGS